MSCVFCNIVNQTLPAKILYEDDHFLAFPDISPQAPTHLLIIPKKHISSICCFSQDDVIITKNIWSVVQKLASDFNLVSSGFRVVTNVGLEGGQTVNHVHFHLLGGRQLQWPPG